MGRTFENPDSWFHTARVRAGFETRPPLAQQLGVSLDTVYLWELGKHRPPWELIGAIANALKVPLPEVVEVLWKEKVEDLCPCGCGGKTVLPEEALDLEGAVVVDGDPDQLRHSRMLPIKLPCTECGKIRIYQHRRKRSHHRALCPSCSRLEEEQPFKCVGYRLPNFDTPQYAKRCPRTILLAPWQIHKRQRWQKDHSDNFFDVSSQRYRCGRCTKAAIPIGNRIERLRELEAKESGQRRSMVEITTRKQLNTLFRKHRDDQDLYRREDGPELLARGLYPLLDRVPEWAQEKGRQTYVEACKTGKKWPEMTKGCMLRDYPALCRQLMDPLQASHC
jgi:DNA-binding XRE family transcriptional regulator